MTGQPKNSDPHLGSSGIVFLRKAIREDPIRTGIIVFLLVLAGIAEGMGFATVLPIISVASDGGLGDSKLEKFVSSGLGVFGASPTVGALLVVFLLGIILKASLTLLAMRHVGYTVARIATNLRLDLIRSVMSANWIYYVNRPVGTFSNAVTIESMRSGQLYSAAYKMSSAAFQSLIYIGISLMMSWQITVAAVVVGAVMFSSMRFLVRIARRAGDAQAIHFETMVVRLTDALSGIKPLKAMGWEGRLLPLLERQANSLNLALRRQIISAEAMRNLQEPIIAIFLSLGLFVALSVLTLETTIVFAMAVIFYRTVSKAAAVQLTFQAMASNQQFYANIQDKIDQARHAQERITGGLAPRFSDSITIEDVRFSYGEHIVLDGVSFEIPFGTITTIRGTSGSGKTTLADLVTGLLTPDQGKILIDGKSLGEMDLAQWRSQIGYVPQELSLLHESILTNVTLTDPELSREDAERALKVAGAWEFVSSLPDGMDTIAGERGTRISGGQRQRIAIARALVRHPRLLILDEATTALDPETEASICKAVKRLSTDTAILAISHQEALTEIADTLYTLDRGVATLVRKNTPAKPSPQSHAAS
jgi:ATP-binding cassette, subfamily C, bacterial